MITIRAAGIILLLAASFPNAPGQVRTREPSPGEAGSRYLSPFEGPGPPQRSGIVPAPVLDYYHSLGWIKTYASRLESSLRGRLPETRQALKQIQTDAAFLQKKWMDWPRLNPDRNPYSAGGTDPYLRTIKQTARQLNLARKSSDPQIVELVKAIAADLRAKAENCRHSRDGLGKDIKVTIRTKRGVQEVAGYEVWCAPMALVRFKEDHVRFPQISSPTTIRSLAPGFYSMWLQKELEKTVGVPQTVGGRGETELEIDLVIPPKTTETTHN